MPALCIVQPQVGEVELMTSVSLFHRLVHILDLMLVTMIISLSVVDVVPESHHARQQHCHKTIMLL